MRLRQNIGDNAKRMRAALNGERSSIPLSAGDEMILRLADQWRELPDNEITVAVGGIPWSRALQTVLCWSLVYNVAYCVGLVIVHLWR